jgi:hypothetical protein
MIQKQCYLHNLNNNNLFVIKKWEKEDMCIYKNAVSILMFSRIIANIK